MSEFGDHAEQALANMIEELSNSPVSDAIIALGSAEIKGVTYQIQLIMTPLSGKAAIKPGEKVLISHTPFIQMGKGGEA